MKTRFGIKRKFRVLFSYYNLFRFGLRKILIGFDYANLLLQNVDKYSVKFILKKYGAIIGENCDIETGLTFHNCINYKNLIIGDNCHIGKNCFFDLRDKIEIGSNVVISMHCSFITHIDMSKSDLNELYPPRQAPITIKNNVYVGVHSTILMGIVLNENCLIAANSLVIHDVEPNTMVGGVPANFIKRIF